MNKCVSFCSAAEIKLALKMKLKLIHAEKKLAYTQKTDQSGYLVRDNLKNVDEFKCFNFLFSD